MSEERKKVELSDDEVVQVSGGQFINPLNVADTRVECDRCYEERTIAGFVPLDASIDCPQCRKGKMHVKIWYDEQENMFFPKDYEG